MLATFNLNRLANAATVAAMTLGVTFAAQPAQKASAQVVLSPLTQNTDIVGAGSGSISTAKIAPSNQMQVLRL